MGTSLLQRRVAGKENRRVPRSRPGHTLATLATVVASARMRPVESVEQPRGIHLRVDLCGGKARVSKQLLDRAQVAASRQKMGGEGMAKGMGRGAVGKAGREVFQRERSKWYRLATRNSEHPQGLELVGSLAEQNTQYDIIARRFRAYSDGRATK